MPAGKYIAHGVPDTYPGVAPSAPARAGSWLIPAPAQPFGSWASRGTLTGEPGTQPVAAPAPLPGLDTERTAQANAGVIGLPSSQVPPAIYPSLYFQRPALNPALAPPVSYVSDNALPVPAVDPRGLPAVMATPPPRIGGRNQVVSPYAVYNWPKWMGPPAS
jgi:hypothetical protein